MPSEDKNEQGEEKQFQPAPSIVEEVKVLKEQLMQLSKEELADRLAYYEYVIPKLGPYVKWFLENYYKPIYVRFRVGRETVGLLTGALLVPEKFELLAEEKVTKYEGQKMWAKYDLRKVIVPVKELSYYDVVLEEGKWEEEELTY